jgi:hypothetical protein
MRTLRTITRVSLGVLLLTACARLAGAQTYVWTDERGVVHAASDPSEVPENQRAKAIRDAANRRPAATSDSQASDSPAPVVPPRQHRSSAAKDEAPAAPTRSYEGDDPAETAGGGVGLDAKPEETPAPEPKRAAQEEPEAKKLTKGLPPPDEGFEWHCATDPEGGPPKCEQFEKKSSKRARRAEAREKAREALGVEGTDEFDPEVAKRVDERAEQEFKKTTPVAKTKAPKASDEEDSGDESDSSDESDD